MDIFDRQNYIRKYEDSTFEQLLESGVIDVMINNNLEKNGSEGLWDNDRKTMLSEVFQHLLDELDTNGDMLEEIKISLDNDWDRERGISNDYDVISDIEKIQKQLELDLACVTHAPERVILAYHFAWVRGGMQKSWTVEPDLI